jgi:hypothetical protein
MTLGTDQLRGLRQPGFAANRGFSKGIARAFISPSSEISYNRYRRFAGYAGRRTLWAIVA